MPSDTLLYFLALATDPLSEDRTKLPADLASAEDVLKFLSSLNIDRFQLGGDETVGRGIVKLNFLEVKKNGKSKPDLNS